MCNENGHRLPAPTGLRGGPGRVHRASSFPLLIRLPYSCEGPRDVESISVVNVLLKRLLMLPVDLYC